MKGCWVSVGNYEPEQSLFGSSNFELHSIARRLIYLLPVVTVATVVS